MHNFIFTATGNFIKRNNIIENFVNNFSVSNDQICIDDTCLTKSEITLIKNQVTMSEIDKIINDKDSISNGDVIIYAKDIFRQIKNSNDDQYKSTLFDKYLTYGIFDDRTKSVYPINKYYLEMDFESFYQSMDNTTIYSSTLSESDVTEILKSNRIDDGQDERKKYVIIKDSDIIGVNNVLHIFFINAYTFVLLKIRTDDEFRWRLIIMDDNLINKISLEIDENYLLMFKDNFNNIVLINAKDEILRLDFLNLIDNYKSISINDGEYDYNILKINFFINYYDSILNLENYDEDYFNVNIINSNVFDKREFPSDKIIDLKIKMDLEDIGLIYYKLSNELFIYLVKVFSKDNDDYQWKILILENSI